MCVAIVTTRLASMRSCRRVTELFAKTHSFRLCSTSVKVTMPEPRTMAVAQRKPSTKSLVLDTMFLFSWLQWLCVYLAADGTSRHGGGWRNKNEVAAA